MMEYVYFSFKPFGDDSVFTSEQFKGSIASFTSTQSIVVNIRGFLIEHY